ncbi:hypothetical protein [Streptomyces sp. BBFR102]|uniref:hypothetical protein n=1 Tax=Streptomyces sp. BBFR102 TaxID=3448171 RepID=UPI003F53A334
MSHGRQVTAWSDGQDEVRQGFWLENLCFSPASSGPPAVLALDMFDRPGDAVRRLCEQVRIAHASSVIPRAMEEVVARARSRRVGALAALHRGEPCGFVLDLPSGARLHWEIRPMPYLLIRPAP